MNDLRCDMAEQTSRHLIKRAPGVTRDELIAPFGSSLVPRLYVFISNSKSMQKQMVAYGSGISAGHMFPKFAVMANCELNYMNLGDPFHTGLHAAAHLSVEECKWF